MSRLTPRFVQDLDPGLFLIAVLADGRELKLHITLLNLNQRRTMIGKHPPAQKQPKITWIIPILVGPRIEAANGYGYRITTSNAYVHSNFRGEPRIFPGRNAADDFRSGDLFIFRGR